MNKIYKKNEVTFAIILIVIYVVGTSLAESLTESMGIAKLVPALFHVAFSAVIIAWIFKNGHAEKYGLSLPKYKLSQTWFFIPLVLVACFGLAFGVKLQYEITETVLFVVSMVCVGFLEEIIFRGFLFVGMARKNVTSAIIVSSITFGIGHIVNLFNGQDIFKTIMQIIFAVAVGFALVTIFYRGKSLLPCIAFHALNNSLSAFEKTNEEIAASLSMSTEQFEMTVIGIFVLLLTTYAVVMTKKLNVSKE